MVPLIKTSGTASPPVYLAGRALPSGCPQPALGTKTQPRPSKHLLTWTWRDFLNSWQTACSHTELLPGSTPVPAEDWTLLLCCAPHRAAALTFHVKDGPSTTFPHKITEPEGLGYRVWTAALQRHMLLEKSVSKYSSQQNGRKGMILYTGIFP